MKKAIQAAIIILSLAAVASAAEKPLEPGSMILDGAAFFASQTGDAYSDLTQVSISPAVARFVSSGTFLGAQFQLSWVSRGSYDRTEYLFGPIIGHYFSNSKDENDVKGDTYPFIKGLFSFGGIESDYTVIQFGGCTGVTYMLSSSVGLDFSANLSYDIWSGGGDSETGITILAGIGFTSFLY